MAEIDTRPANCRHRLQDEGKAYPRSSCTHCGKSVMNGLGVACTLGVVGGGDPAQLETKAGFKFVAAPLPEWGKVVSMIEFGGTIFVACEFGVFKLVDGKLEPVMFVSGGGR